MNGYCKYLIVGATALPLLLVFAIQANSTGPKVSENLNKHNLSSGVYNTSANPSVRTGDRDSSITYRAKYYGDGSNPLGQQVCIFCHTPHSSNNNTEQTPLWSRKFSLQTFSRYSSATLQIRVNSTISAPGMANYGTNWVPDGASKLCLSCHDGVSNLGDLFRGVSIEMDSTMDPGSGGNYITTIASFKPSTNKMKTGHHPVSFVYNGTVQQAISSVRVTAGFQLPTAVPQVKLDKNNKMQCTTCHNAHQNQSDDDWCYWSSGGPGLCSNPLSTGRKMVPFWVLPGSDATIAHDTVCTSCHNMYEANPLGTPTRPWP